MVRRRMQLANSAAFTLVEVMVAMCIVMAIVGMLFAIVSRATEGTRAASSRQDQFQQAQGAFETLTRRIGQATLNNYWDSYSVNATVRRYQRMSELRFVCGPMQCGANPLDATVSKIRPGHGVFFQATSGRSGAARDPSLVGLESLVNSWGYFVEVGTDGMAMPSFLASQPDLDPITPRLMEMCEPAQSLGIYAYTSGKPDYSGFEWFRTPLANRALLRPVAKNIALLLVQPKLTAQESERLLPSGTAAERDAMLAPQLFYHSGAPAPSGTDRAHNMRHRLPAMAEITMVALDAATVSRLYGPGDLDPLKLRDAFHAASTLRSELQGDPENAKMDSLERRLIARHASYRIFTATIPIRAAQ